ncbi:MAG TPA: HNH endonuclease [Leptolyngbyaceae cyanobacterium M33_DOE_097]|nr:HNH endonuclease [Leptolyngbyaceae cyanobacterium M33_DOE_097]
MFETDLVFESKDLSIFQIPDLKTRLNTLQNYFFPRLDRLITESLELIQEIYQIEPYEKLTILRSPSHRKHSENNRDQPYVLIGIGGKRKNQPLEVINKAGKPYNHHIGRLYYMMESDGSLGIFLHLLTHLEPSLNTKVLSIWKNLLVENFQTLNNIFTLNHIYHSYSHEFINFSEVLYQDWFGWSEALQFHSPIYYLPVSFETSLFSLQIAFAALYPLLDASIDIEKGKEHQLESLLDSYINWYRNGGASHWYQKKSKAQPDELNEAIQLPELDSYQFIRTGLWWEILARDNWTCCSCGRSVKQHGITLHVDHILPRSKGGDDTKQNLQTLCMKCNIGKSNRDSTDLRA